MKGEQEIRRLLRQWIVEHCRQDVAVFDIDDATPILVSGLLSSIQVAELVLYIEHLLGAEIPLDDLEADVFHSVDALWQRLFAPWVQPAVGRAREIRAR